MMLELEDSFGRLRVRPVPFACSSCSVPAGILGRRRSRRRCRHSAAGRPTGLRRPADRGLTPVRRALLALNNLSGRQRASSTARPWALASAWPASRRVNTSVERAFRHARPKVVFIPSYHSPSWCGGSGLGPRGSRQSPGVHRRPRRRGAWRWQPSLRRQSPTSTGRSRRCATILNLEPQAVATVQPWCLSCSTEDVPAVRDDAAESLVGLLRPAGCEEARMRSRQDGPRHGPRYRTMKNYRHIECGRSSGAAG